MPRVKRVYNFIARIASGVEFRFSHKSFFLSVWYPQLPSNKPQTNPKDVIQLGFPDNASTD